jgi:Rieske Fe-S protein
MNTRRKFIADLCKVCLLAGTAGAAATFLESCNTLKVVRATPSGDNDIQIPLTAFAEQTQVLARSSKTVFDILVSRKADLTYTALLMQCTHESQPLTASGTSIFCSSHGSKFDLDGKVLLGPAARPLQRYPVTVTDTNLIIHLKSNP